MLAVKRDDNLIGMDIDAKQLAYKPRKVGMLGGQPVMETATKGGLNMIVNSAGKPLSVAPHRAIARMIAKKLNPSLQFVDLAKGDWVSPESVAWLLPKWENVTNQMQELFDERHSS